MNDLRFRAHGAEVVDTVDDAGTWTVWCACGWGSAKGTHGKHAAHEHKPTRRCDTSREAVTRAAWVAAVMENAALLEELESEEAR